MCACVSVCVACVFVLGGLLSTSPGLSADSLPTLSNAYPSHPSHLSHPPADPSAQLEHAMWSLKQSLKWDEDTFGLECDLGEARR